MIKRPKKTRQYQDKQIMHRSERQKYYLTYQGIDHLKRGMEFRHDEQTERNWRTSVRLSRRVPIDFSKSRGSSDHWTGAMHGMFGFVEAELDVVVEDDTGQGY